MQKTVRNLFSALLAAAMLLALQFTALAESYVYYAGYMFSLESGNACIHSYDGDERDLYIPETIWGYTVTGIDNNAFFERSDFTALYLQDGKKLTSIGNNAFYGCAGFDYAELPPEVESLGECAFQGCSGLKTVVLNNELTEIRQQTFYGCSSLEAVNIPDSVKSIGKYAFANCKSLAKVNIPDSVTEIDGNAFDDSDNAVIYCTKSSYALEYAKANNIKYVITDETYIPGDANLDGEVDIDDVTLIQQHRVGIKLIMGEAVKSADPNGDGSITVRDATLIQMYLVGMDNRYHIGESVPVYQKTVN